MPTNFCHNCGKPAQADWKGCPYCQTSFASLSEKPPVQQQVKPNRPIHRPAPATVGFVNADDEDTDYLDTVAHYQPSIDALQVEIQKPRFSNAETIGQLATSPIANVSDVPRNAPPTLSPEEALRQFQQEAGGGAKRIEVN